jgi:hypothetical protein
MRIDQPAPYLVNSRGERRITNPFFARPAGEGFRLQDALGFVRELYHSVL